MARMEDGETLRRFVLRARRVQAHSMVQDWDGLLRHAAGSFDGHLDLTGRMTITRRLPHDEEIFESLASRVRPITVKSEPVYYVKVFDAIERAIGDADIDEPLRRRIQDLRRAWEASEIQGTQVQAYAMQSARLDGTEATNMVSDTQLAAAWLYADLVHADAQGPKQEALAFSLRERYAAAVRVFSHMAALAVATVQLVEALRDCGVLAIDNSAWEDDVAVGTSELVDEARAYVAPLGSQMPDIRDSLELAEGWSAFSVTELLRQNPSNHVTVILREEDGSTIASYDAAVARRHPEAASLEWDVLVAGSIMFKFSFVIQDERITGGPVPRVGCVRLNQRTQARFDAPSAGTPPHCVDDLRGWRKSTAVSGAAYLHQRPAARVGSDCGDHRGHRQDRTSLWSNVRPMQRTL